MKKIVIAIALLPFALFSQHKIEGTFSPVEEFTYAFLYHSTPSGNTYVNRSKMKTDGSFKITIDSSATSGIYKIVYGLPAEENYFEFIYNKKEDVNLSFSTSNGLKFYESQENKLWASYTNSMGLVNTSISNFYTQQSEDEKAFKDIFNTLADTQNAYEEASKGMLVEQFIKANRPYIPQRYENISTYSKNLKHNYLKHIDFSNPLLQSSDFLSNRVLSFIFGMAAQIDDDTYKSNVDLLVSAIGENKLEIKQTLLLLIRDHFIDLENEALANYIAETYLLEITKLTNNQELTQELMRFKNNSVGQKAQDFAIPNTDNNQRAATTLHNLEGASRYVLIFWSSACSHCLEELPKVNRIIPPDTKVIAYDIEGDLENWKKQRANFSNFIHILGHGKWENELVNTYNVKSTPTYYILDSNKTITAKPFDFKALESTLQSKPVN